MFETKTIKTSIPPTPGYELEQTTFTCSVCNHEANSEEDIRNHFGREHSVLDFIPPNSDDDEKFPEYLKFETEEKANAYLTWRRTTYFWSAIQELKWKGPGWYHCKIVDKLRGCSCRCSDEYLVLYPLINDINEKLYKMKDLEMQVEILRDIIAK